MEVRLLEATEDPERTICTAARNDYMTEFVGDCSFEDVMESIDGLCRRAVPGSDDGDRRG